MIYQADTKYGYLYQSDYARHLRRFFSLFSSGQIYILPFEELIADPVKEVGKLYEFLDVGEYKIKNLRPENQDTEAKKIPIDEEFTEELQSRFGEKIQELYSLINRDLGW